MRTTRVVDEKQQILDDAGYRYHFDRQLYFNRNAKKAFSVEFIDDRSEEEIKQRIQDHSSSTEWRFFFNGGEPSTAVRRELVNVLEQ
jgi:hypothetical protein